MEDGSRAEHHRFVRSNTHRFRGGGRQRVYPRADESASAPRSDRRRKSSRVEEEMGEMNWVSRKIHLYNVTMGLYMLDWWERCLFNIMVLILLWFICFNGSRFANDVFERSMACELGG
ncbi:hypothetical protein ABZP36_000108 [Zizania latifolia]